METWKAVKRNSCYEVSDSGRVRRVVPASGTRPGTILKPQYNNRGYARVTLSVGSEKHHEFVHHLVAEAFLGPRPDGMCVDHRDDDKSRNEASNLQYVTLSENTSK